jgi:hypothetical protein
MALIESDHMIKQIAPAASNPTLGHSILPGTLEGSPHRCKLNRLHSRKHFVSKLPITIKDQVLLPVFGRKRFPKLLRNPDAVRVSGHIEVQNAPSIMRDHKEAIKNAEREGWHCEEIHCRNHFTMVA